MVTLKDLWRSAAFALGVALMLTSMVNGQGNGLFPPPNFGSERAAYESASALWASDSGSMTGAFDSEFGRATGVASTRNAAATLPLGTKGSGRLPTYTVKTVSVNEAPPTYGLTQPQSGFVQSIPSVNNQVPVYGVPNPIYGGPAQSYGPTVPAYGVPSQSYSAPASNIGNVAGVAFDGSVASQQTFPCDPTPTLTEFQPSQPAACGPSCGEGCFGVGRCGASPNCSGLCGPVCGPCSWGRVDLLLWHLGGYSTPPLITSGHGNVPADQVALLGQNGTSVLFGNNKVGDGLRLGTRLQFGHWFGPSRRLGVQGEFLWLGDEDSTRIFRGDGDKTYARPFFNTNPDVNGQDAQIFSRPGLAEGSVRFNTSSRVFSAAPSLRWNLCCCSDPCSGNQSSRVDLLLGYRYFGLDERFASQETLRPTDTQFVDGTSFELNDRIRTDNQFHGVEVGMNHMRQLGRWYWDFSTIIAVGEMRSLISLDGSTRINVPDFRDATFPGGFYVAPENVGSFRDTETTVIPQLRLNLSYCIGRNWRLGAGYTMMYVDSVFRPGSFVNTQFDGTRLGQTQTDADFVRPAAARESLFLHGANIGLSYNF